MPEVALPYLEAVIILEPDDDQEPDAPRYQAPEGQEQHEAQPIRHALPFVERPPLADGLSFEVEGVTRSRGSKSSLVVGCPARDRSGALASHVSLSERNSGLFVVVNSIVNATSEGVISISPCGAARIASKILPA